MGQGSRETDIPMPQTEELKFLKPLGKIFIKVKQRSAHFNPEIPLLIIYFGESVCSSCFCHAFKHIYTHDYI